MLDVPSIEQYDKIKYNFRMYMEMGGNIYYEKKKSNIPIVYRISLGNVQLRK